MNNLKKKPFAVIWLAIITALPILAHAYPTDPEECMAAEGKWIDFKTTPPDGWCRGAKATPQGPVMICAKVRGIEQKVGTEMVCMPRDVARQKLLLENDVPDKASEAK